MQKKYVVLGIVLGCLLGIYVVHQFQKPVKVEQQVVRTRELPIVAKLIDVKQNRYGDYLAGIMAQNNQDYAKMVEYFEKSLSDDKDNQKLKATLYLLKLIQGRVDDAVVLAEDLQRSKQAQLLTDYVLVSDAFLKKDYEKALKILSEKPKYGLDPVLVPMTRAWIMAAKGQYEEADQILSKGHDKALMAYYRALLATMMEQKDKAEKWIAEFKKLSAKGYPSLTAVVFLKGINERDKTWSKGHDDFDKIYAFLDKSAILKEAFQNIKIPSKITPEMGLAIGFYDVSVALAPLKSKETSLVFNALAMHLAPDLVIPKIWGGELLEASKNYRLANRLYQNIKNPSDVILIKMIVNHVADEKYQESLGLAQQVVAHNPEDASLYSLLGDIEGKLKHYDKALEAYQKAYDLFQKKNDKENMGGACMGIATIYEEMGNQPEQVEAYLLKALELLPENPLVLNFLGYTWLEKNKNISRAFAMVQKANQLMPEEPEIMDSLAFGYYMKKEYDKALPLAEQATDKLPYSSVAYGHLGDIYHALGQVRNAKYQYQKALALSKDITPKLRRELEEKLKACQN